MDIYETLRQNAKKNRRARPLPRDWRMRFRPGAWVVVYTNPYANRREVSPAYKTMEDAQKNAEFLRFQGARYIKIEQI